MNIPIPHYPPFKLRSSLIDKDPVIWVHLLEDYHRLCAALLAGVALDVKSQQQLQLFFKVYLAETASESTRVFSLGAVSPEIRNNTAVLRAYVFQVICDYGAVKLALSGESLWHFVCIYVAKNATLVRGVVGGTYKSKFNDNKKSGNISSAPVVRKHLMAAMAQGSLTATDLETLALLLGQRKTEKSESSRKVLAKDLGRAGAASAAAFAERFVTSDWLEDLESLHAAGTGVHAATARDWMVVSVLSLPPAKMAAVLTSMGISSAAAMAVAPLLCSLVTSDAYRAVCPGLEERLPFLKSDLKSGAGEPVSEKDVMFLTEMFPKLHSQKATYFLRQYGDVDAVVGALLADESLIDAVPEPQPEPVTVSASELARGVERFKLGANETLNSVQKAQPMEAASTKEKTLTAALRLLYDSDEDERDDTYDDQEHTTASSLDQKGRDRGAEPPKSEFDQNELILFGYLKKDESLLSKMARKKPQRAQMKAATKWSDEQIEGWSRMLKRSSKRFRLLEEQYVLVNSNRKPKPEPESSDEQSESDDDSAEENSSKQNASQGSRQTSNQPKQTSNSPKPKQGSDKKNFRKKEANKAKSANHSRKAGHGKKMKSELAGMQ